MAEVSVDGEEVVFEGEAPQEAGQVENSNAAAAELVGRRVSLLDTFVSDLETLTHIGSATSPLMRSTRSSWVSSLILKEAVR